MPAWVSSACASFAKVATKSRVSGVLRSVARPGWPSGRLCAFSVRTFDFRIKRPRASSGPRALKGGGAAWSCVGPGQVLGRAGMFWICCIAGSNHALSEGVEWSRRWGDGTQNRAGTHRSAVSEGWRCAEEKSRANNTLVVSSCSQSQKSADVGTLTPRAIIWIWRSLRPRWRPGSTMPSPFIASLDSWISTAVSHPRFILRALATYRSPCPSCRHSRRGFPTQYRSSWCVMRVFGGKGRVILRRAVGVSMCV